jgi:hypothetical protein
VHLRGEGRARWGEVRCDGPLVVIEGTARQIARSRFPPRPEPALLGMSATMDHWPYY